MKALIAAAINSTEYSDLSVDAIYKMFRAKFPDTVNPMKAMEMEERRSLWTTYPNLNKWFDGSKECLIHYGYAEDKPQCVIDIFEGRKPPVPMMMLMKMENLQLGLSQGFIILY